MRRSTGRRWAILLTAAALMVVAACAKPAEAPQQSTTSGSVQPTSKAVNGGPNSFSPKPLPPLTPVVPTQGAATP
ncbi:hypothetical protein [Mycobacterium sp. DL592]|uniref:hypothetical protein n=1 Tax=Mycobacterium sp. DL592 TaxID=2675524 RepID=UPI00141DE9DA|nr:hypothetical protein [Mycobacterium sp. DL592]